MSMKRSDGWFCAFYEITKQTSCHADLVIASLAKNYACWEDCKFTEYFVESEHENEQAPAVQDEMHLKNV